jgi:homoserine dehydrogenase
MSKFAVLGYGVVGSGVVELFYTNKEKIVSKAGQPMDIKYILDIREFPDSPYADKFVKSIETILADDEVTAVAECMGGVRPAYEFVKACLEKGKSVSTSNKQLVAEKGAELLKVAKAHNCNFFFEASVGGAIPIIRPLHKCLAANEITEVAGILNGTTNFILTKMINENMEFGTALAMAQKLGYAEKDPTADVEGEDACRKICIISSLVYGKHVYPDSVYTKGITDIQLEDVKYVKQWGGAIKLIAYVKKLEDGRIIPLVCPMLVSDSNLISHVDDVFNAVMVCGNGIDKTLFYGRGAGKLPTASAVLGDIINEVQHSETVLSQHWEDSDNTDFIAHYGDFVSQMYFRIKGDTSLLPEGATVIANDDDYLVFITEPMSMDKSDELCVSITENGGNIVSKIPVLDIQ